MNLEKPGVSDFPLLSNITYPSLPHIVSCSTKLHNVVFGLGLGHRRWALFRLHFKKEWSVLGCTVGGRTGEDITQLHLRVECVF